MYKKPKIASDAFLKRHGHMTRKEELKEFGEALAKVSYVCDGCNDAISSIKTVDGRHLCFKCWEKLKKENKIV